MKTKNTVSPIVIVDQRHPNDSIISNAQNLFGKRYALIPVSEIDVDYTYQRQQKDANVRNLAQNWNDEIYDPIKVTYRDNRFKAFDGGHRLYAQIMMGRGEVVCEICAEASLEAEAYRFVHQFDHVVRPKPVDTFNANVLLGDPVDCAIKKLCEKHNVTLAYKSTQKPRTLTNLNRAREVVRICGEDCLAWIFEIVDECGWLEIPRGLSGFTIVLLRSMWQEFRNHRDAAKKAIINYLAVDPKMSPKTLAGISCGMRPDLSAAQAAYVFMKGEIEKRMFVQFIEGK